MIDRRSAAMPYGLVRGKAFSGSLGPLVVGRAETMSGRNRAVLFLEAGEAQVTLDGRTLRIAGPALLWTPWPLDARMSISPGAVGLYLIVGTTTLQNAIGHAPEAAELRALSDRQFTVSLADRPDLTRRARAGIEAILEEQSIAAAAARSIIEAHLRVLLVRLWRAADVSGRPGNPRSPSGQIFNRFSQLVELHFRDRWTVQDYAAALGLSRDRLGDICRRVGGRPAKEVIAARVLLEARLLLEHSSHSVEQIAALLGFPSASQFSRAFSAATGQPPSRFRADRASAAQGEGTALHAWP